MNKKAWTRIFFILGNIFVIAIVPSVMILAVGNTTVTIKAIELSNKLQIEQNAKNIQIIMSHAQESNMFYFKWRTIVLCSYVVFLSAWVLFSVKNFISFLEDLM